MILRLYDDEDDCDDNSITVNFRAIRRTKTHEIVSRDESKRCCPFPSAASPAASPPASFDRRDAARDAARAREFCAPRVRPRVPTPASPSAAQRGRELGKGRASRALRARDQRLEKRYSVT
ncbi:unnamed protein product [Trichogramma brassicae]|uniref:Uncharacterized protein n=1 Tax=Trichogramma brassicae TaxID=86971 RepID=A0A6H5J2C3_9HYME|nr:unnamed protein product [Trichogramma brassicae]